MLIDFNNVKEITVPGMNNGTGTMTAKMYMDEQGKLYLAPFTRAVLSVCTNTKQVMI